MPHTAAIRACLAALSALTLACEPGAPREPIDKSFFIGTWHSDSPCLENIIFSELDAEWEINYRTCLSDTIQDPYQFVDSVIYDTVRDSFLIMGYMGWEASDSEIVFYDTVTMPGGAVATTSTHLQIEVRSTFQFYVESILDTSRTLYTKL